jgi:hypothetical protein
MSLQCPIRFVKVLRDIFSKISRQVTSEPNFLFAPSDSYGVANSHVKGSFPGWFYMYAADNRRCCIVRGVIVECRYLLVHTSDSNRSFFLRWRDGKRDPQIKKRLRVKVAIKLYGRSCENSKILSRNRRDESRAFWSPHFSVHGSFPFPSPPSKYSKR